MALGVVPPTEASIMVVEASRHGPLHDPWGQTSPLWSVQREGGLTCPAAAAEGKELRDRSPQVHWCECNSASCPVGGKTCRCCIGKGASHRCERSRSALYRSEAEQ